MTLGSKSENNTEKAHIGGLYAQLPCAETNSQRLSSNRIPYLAQIYANEQMSSDKDLGIKGGFGVFGISVLTLVSQLTFHSYPA